MNQAISSIEDKDEVDLTCWIQAAALRLESDAVFSELLLQVVDRLKEAVYRSLLCRSISWRRSRTAIR